MNIKLRPFTLVLYLCVILLFLGCQTKAPITVPSADMYPILQTNYYLRLPAGYQFTPFWGDSGQSGKAVHLIYIDPPASHPEIWIWPVTIGKPENFKEDFLPPEQIYLDPLSIYLAKFAFEEDKVSQLLALGQVGQNVVGEAEGLSIHVFGAFSQQEEGYQVLKELLQSITYIAPTPEP